MFATIVNIIYGFVVFIYYFPFAATFILPVMEQQGLLDEVPAWVNDTSWRGFWLSPYRMFKEIF